MDQLPLQTQRCVLAQAASWLEVEQVRQLQWSVVRIFARLIVLVPALSSYLDSFIERMESVSTSSKALDFMMETEASTSTLCNNLIAVLRLLALDRQIYSQQISPIRVVNLLGSSSQAVRYLAIRVLGIYFPLSTTTIREYISTYVKDAQVLGPWDEKEIDYSFIDLWESQRILADRASLIAEPDRLISAAPRQDQDFQSTPLTLPTDPISRKPYLREQAFRSGATALYPTASTTENLEKLGDALLQRKPVLIAGLSGSGKSAIILDAARRASKADKMLVLHLNQQTDARALIGGYVSDSQPGTFLWRPGPLATAMSEGRWVVIEDIDQAPNEVLSILRFVVENRMLIVPGRGEVIRTVPGFKLLATLRSYHNPQGHEVVPSQKFLGPWRWSQVMLVYPPRDDQLLVIRQRYPQLTPFMSLITKIIDIMESDLFKASHGRRLDFRTVLEMTNRMAATVSTRGWTTSNQPVPEALYDEMFLDTLDSLVAWVPHFERRRTLYEALAPAFNIAPARITLLTTLRCPRCSENLKAIIIGRGRLARRSRTHQPTRNRKTAQQTFANTLSSLQLLETLILSATAREPVLLVGETGTGKTSAIQYLADVIGQDLHVLNLSQQTELSDLVGSLKPVTLKSLAIPINNRFDTLFAATFSAGKNQHFIERLKQSVLQGKWSRAIKHWREACQLADKLFAAAEDPAKSRAQGIEDGQQVKRRKINQANLALLQPEWGHFRIELLKFEKRVQAGERGVSFDFVENQLITAVRQGTWVLFDEINLASSEVLDAISDLLTPIRDGGPSILLTESGSMERIRAHPDFRIFAAMNPATDVGRKDLSPGLRSRFTETYVFSPDSHFEDLQAIVRAYLRPWQQRDERAVQDVTNLHLAIKRLDEQNQLVDGAGQRPHFSLRTLTRALTYAVDISPLYGVRRSLYEAFSMTFVTFLDQASERKVISLIYQHILAGQRNAKSLLRQAPAQPTDGRSYIPFEHYWISQGKQAPVEQPQYIITPFVRKSLLALVRASSSRRYPVLLQGPTSSGKTSMIEYLAKRSGNDFVRINNHEFTDLQEYMGQYVSGKEGQIVFQEGVLVNAVRNGSWIVLDELNLAPTEVLEALNRLLDDNQELLIPETQEILRPHPNFMLFATQNPAGMYGGRKHLSRALRNRFIELHFDDIPSNELETILAQRSRLPPSFCSRIIAVHQELARERSPTRLFENKNNSATLRDLFRWAQRPADSKEQLAMNGFALLGERVRTQQERDIVRTAIEKVFSLRLDTEEMYGMSALQSLLPAGHRPEQSGIVWTAAARRLYILLALAAKSNEPVLLIGETGTGKTSICQVVARLLGQELSITNAHQNMETSDLIGQYRPNRSRDAAEEDLATLLPPYIDSSDASSLSTRELVQIWETRQSGGGVSPSIPEVHEMRIQQSVDQLASLFEWKDGSLVDAMRQGRPFLLDEISLADDAVLERLNSVLEPARSLLLAEKGPHDALVQAANGFQFFATMNPGGDYGKKELSPALRNRFTEIWVPAITSQEDVLQIAQARLRSEAAKYAVPVVQFAQWFGQKYRNETSISLRGVLNWIGFINTGHSPDVLHEGASLVCLDSIGTDLGNSLVLSRQERSRLRDECHQHLSLLLGEDPAYQPPANLSVQLADHLFSLGGYVLERNPSSAQMSSVSLEAPTPRLNMLRIVRAMQINKPLLLEGSPGVGKTTLVITLAAIVGHPLFRLNLSEQTDLTDLFGSDVPIAGETAGNFGWRNGPFLDAMQNGQWVLLDEMNLASQSVLEGLNACLDHRAEVYIPELGRTFHCHPDFRLFATQNPYSQGGGRKGLPKSFLNRFIVVHTEPLEQADLEMICHQVYPQLSADRITETVSYINALTTATTRDRLLGALGQPWEFNLRDTLRWLELQQTVQNGAFPKDGTGFLDLIAVGRFRLAEDREKARRLYEHVVGRPTSMRQISIISDGAIGLLFIGSAVLRRQPSSSNAEPGFTPYHGHRKSLESLAICIGASWPCLLVGPGAAGKTNMIRYLAFNLGAQIRHIDMNPDVEASDLVGGFEQADIAQHFARLASMFANKLRDLPIQPGQQMEPQLMIELERASALAASAAQQDGQRVLDDILAALHNCTKFLSTEQVRECFDAVEELRSALSRHSARFEWTDGPLIQALDKGEWLVLDNANLCNPSVLDRLNSLLEPGGNIVLNEKGSADGQLQTVKPHPDFRVILTMDPKHGELSRALRNRCVEIFVPGVTDAEIHDEQLSFPVYHDISTPGLQGICAVLNRASDVHDAQVVILDVVGRCKLQDMPALICFAEELQKGMVAYEPCMLSELLAQSQELRDMYGNSSLESIFSKRGRVDQQHESMNALLEPRSVPVAETLAIFARQKTLAQSLALGEPHSTEGFISPIWTSLLLHLGRKLACIFRALRTVEANGSGEKGIQVSHLTLLLRSGEVRHDLASALWSLLWRLANNILSKVGLDLTDPVELEERVRWLSRFVSGFEQAVALLSGANLSAGVPGVILTVTTARLVDSAECQSVWNRQDDQQLLTEAGRIVEATRRWQAPIDLFWSAFGGNSIRDEVHWEMLKKSKKLKDDLLARMWIEPVRLDTLHRDRRLLEQLRDLAKLPTAALIQQVIDEAAGATASRAEKTEYQDIVQPLLAREFSSLMVLNAAVDRPIDDSEDLLKSWLPMALVDPVALVLLGEELLLESLSTRIATNVATLRQPSLRQLSVSREEVRTLGAIVAAYPQIQQAPSGAVARKKLAGFRNRLAATSQAMQISESLMGSVTQILDASAHLLTFETTLEEQALTWLSTGFSCLRQFISKTAYDPQISRDISQNLSAGRIQGLEDEIKAWKWVEKTLTGGDWNLMIAWGESELARLREDTSSESVLTGTTSRYRPDDRLQFEELHRLLVDIRGTIPEDAKDDEIVMKQLTKAGHAAIESRKQLILQQIGKLPGYDVYRNLTKPARIFLEQVYYGLCLLQLLLKCEASLNGGEELSIQLQLPMDGGWPADLEIWRRNDGTTRRDRGFDVIRLEFMAVQLRHECIAKQKAKMYRKVISVFDDLYRGWKDRLHKDQEAAMKTSSLYRYTGERDDEDEVEEVARLFGRMQSGRTESESDGDRLTHKEDLEHLARVHAVIFQEGISRDIHQDLLRFIKQSDLNWTSNSTLRQLIQIQTTQQVLQSQSSPGSFYHQANLKQIETLLELLYSIQARFLQLWRIWPEHSTIQEVLLKCKEILGRSSIEPLAKIITDVEQLHAILYQWQSIADREHTAVKQYNELTALLISWRRLELRSWSVLLKEEDTSCVKDAYGWWYIGYEAIIASADDYASDPSQIPQLVRTVLEFMNSTPVGQFTTRLQILRQLHAELAISSQSKQSLDRIRDALSNTITYFSRFTSDVERYLNESRKKLQKQSEEVILLATWKDTNIVALRESARRSHVKLFRIVKKYRVVLSKPAQEICSEPLRSLLDDFPKLASPVQDRRGVSGLVGADYGALAKALSDRYDFSRDRLQSYTRSITAVDDHRQKMQLLRRAVDDKMSNFATNVATLQKATPTYLTEENKPEVRHVKAQKRLLFAEMLKWLKDMGIRANLDASTVEGQYGPPQLLSSRAFRTTKSSTIFNHAEESFQIIVELWPSIRQATSGFSEELSAQEVVRSSGLLDGCLYEVVGQRESLTRASNDLSLLQELYEQSQQLKRVTVDPEEVVRPGMIDGAHGSIDQHQQALDWTLTMLTAGQEALKIQQSLAVGRVEFDLVFESWAKWIADLGATRTELAQIAQTPRALQTAADEFRIVAASQLLENFTVEIRELGQQRPEVKYLTKEIVEWANSTAYSKRDRLSPREEPTVSRLTEKVLVSANHLIECAQQVARVRRNHETADSSQKQWWTSTSRQVQDAVRGLQLEDHVRRLRRCLRDVDNFQVTTHTNKLRIKSSFSILSAVLGHYVELSELTVSQLSDIYQSTTSMTVTLAQHFLLITKKGFCTPGEKQKQDEQGKEKLEEGTGLGDGKGANDVSGDVGDDEDFSELAQEPNARRDEGDEGEMEVERDAVEIADEMEGEMGEGDERGSDDERGGGEDGEEGSVDEERGSVGSADAELGDEKIGGGGKDEEGKTEEGKKSNGKRDKDEQAAGKRQREDQTEMDAEEEDGDDGDADEVTGATGARDDTQADPHAQEQNQLDLPDDMQLDLDKDGEVQENGSDTDEMDAMSDISNPDGPNNLPESEEDAGERQRRDRALEQQLDEIEHAEEAAEQERQDREAESTKQDVDQADEKLDQPGDTQDARAVGEEVDELVSEEPDNRVQAIDDNAEANAQDTVPSDAVGQGQEQADDKASQQQHGSAAQRQQGDKGQAQGSEQTQADVEMEDQEAQYMPSTEQKGDRSQIPTSDQRHNASKSPGQSEEGYHRRQEDILDAPEGQDEQQRKVGEERSHADGAYQHLQEGHEEGYDTQALGTVEAEDQQTVNDKTAIDDEKTIDDAIDLDQIAVGENSEATSQGGNAMDVDDPRDGALSGQRQAQEKAEPYINRPSAKSYQKEAAEDHAASRAALDSPFTDEDHVDDDDPPPKSSKPLAASQLIITPTTASTLWAHYTTTTHPLATRLTESLRLILTPTRNTKFRGAYKSGKRLNMRRIIPYVASGYRKDKIWMRRSGAGKREYRVLVAVDGSRSMGVPLLAVPDQSGNTNLEALGRENGGIKAKSAAQMALYTLALLSQSLTTLEIPQLALLSFGAETNIHKPFLDPLSHQAGAQIVQSITFQEERTDVKRLLGKALEMFSDAAGGVQGQSEVWGLMLIVGDGICEEHEEIRRLVRRLRDEVRVLAVFVVVDVQAMGHQTARAAMATGRTASGGGQPDGDMVMMDAAQLSIAQSATISRASQRRPLPPGPIAPAGGIMNMSRATFVRAPQTGEQKLKMERYLDSFPFEYYIVVRRIEELPEVLSEALRGWFREVVDV